MPQAIETLIVGPATGVGGSRPLRVARLTRLRPGLWVAVLCVTLLLLAAGFPALMAPFDPLDATPRLAFQAPGTPHWLDTDENGRDVLSRLIYGVGPSLFMGLAATAVGLVCCSSPTTRG